MAQFFSLNFQEMQTLTLCLALCGTNLLIPDYRGTPFRCWASQVKAKKTLRDEKVIHLRPKDTATLASWDLKHEKFQLLVTTLEYIFSPD